MPLNITAISFGISAILAVFITTRAYLSWKRQEDNQVGKNYFYAMLFVSLYFSVRAIASFLFFNSASALTVAYILSHVFVAFACAYFVKFTVVILFGTPSVKLLFYLTLFLFAIYIIFNIIYLNNPHFNHELNVIEWGTNKYVGIFYAILGWLVFLSLAASLIYKAVQNWTNNIVRIRCLLMAGSALLTIFVLIPRNISPAPFLILVSDIGFALSLGLIFLSMNYKGKAEEK